MRGRPALTRGSNELSVLMTTDAVGGVWTFAACLASGLSQRGCNVTLVVLGPSPRREQLHRLSANEQVEVVETDLALEWVDPEGRDLARARDTLADIAAARRPDVVHVNGFREAAAHWGAPVIVTAHSCVWSWWQAVHHSNPTEAQWRQYRLNAAEGLDSADAWVAPSLAHRNAVDRVYCPLQIGQVIYNGNACTGFRPLPDGVRENSIISVGRLWDPAKNVDALTRIAKSVEWPIRIAGPDGFQDDTVGDLDNLDWLGELSHRDVMNRMSRSRIFISAAKYEPFGLSVLEAAACGNALVLSDIEAFREIWDEAALFVPQGDESGFARGLSSLIADSRRRNALADAAWRRASRYTAVRTTDSYLSLYRELVQKSDAPIQRHRSAERRIEESAS